MEMEMPFEQSIIWLLLGAILGSGGAVLAGKTVMKKRGFEREDLEDLMQMLENRKRLKKGRDSDA